MDFNKKNRKKKKKKRWGKTEKRYAIIAAIAAVAGILFYAYLIIISSDGMDYSDAPQVTSESEAAILDGYSGKIVISGMLTGTTYTFQDAYKNVEMAEQPDVEGEFLYTELIISRMEEYVTNQNQVKLGREQPEYDTRWNDYGSYRQAEDLNIYGLAVDTENLYMNDISDFGELYDSIHDAETAKLNGIEGPRVSVVVIGDMENGVLVSGTLYVNGTIEEAVANAKLGIPVSFVFLLIWLGLCGFVIWSMSVQSK